MTLYIKDTAGDYRVATPREIVVAARRCVGRLFVRGHSIERPADSIDFFQTKLAGLEAERFAVLFLDQKNRILAYEELFFGTLDAASIHPREVVKRALHHNAAAVILAHNHPSGSVIPSRADEAITLRLREALALVEVRVLDHLIVGDGFTSLAERGVL